MIFLLCTWFQGTEDEMLLHRSGSFLHMYHLRHNLVHLGEWSIPMSQPKDEVKLYSHTYLYHIQFSAFLLPTDNLSFENSHICISNDCMLATSSHRNYITWINYLFHTINYCSAMTGNNSPYFIS